LAQEKQLTRQRDQLNRQCRELSEGPHETSPNYNLTDGVRHHDRYGVDGFFDGNCFTGEVRE